MIREAISRVIERKDLNEKQMVEVMNEIMSGETTPAQIGSFITALRMKGETVEEISGAAMVMREKATRIETGVAIDEGAIHLTFQRRPLLLWLLLGFRWPNMETGPYLPSAAALMCSKPWG